MVTMSWYLVKIVETHLEIIKDEVMCHFHLAAILDSEKEKNGNEFFLNPDVSKI